MRVLLTGATGFIGSHLARLLVREGYEVYAAVRRASNLWRIQDLAPSIHVLQCELLDPGDVDALVARVRPGLCLHLAWYAEPGEYLTSEENIRLLVASLHLARRLADAGCARLLAAGTCFEYDTRLGYLSESSPTKPGSLYAASKLALQLVLERLAANVGMSVAWLRLFYQYGPFEDQRRLVPSVVCSLLRGQQVKVTPGEQVRDYLHVEDVASAVLAVARSGLTGAVNVGSGRPATVREIVATIGGLVGRPDLIVLGALPYAPSDPMFICADNRRLVEGSSWVARYDLGEGLRHTVEWWRGYLGGHVDPTGA